MKSSEFMMGVQHGRNNPVYFRCDECMPHEGQRVFAAVFDGDEVWELEAVFDGYSFFNGTTELYNVQKWCPLPSL